MKEIDLQLAFASYYRRIGCTVELEVYTKMGFVDALLDCSSFRHLFEFKRKGTLPIIRYAIGQVLLYQSFFPDYDAFVGVPWEGNSDLRCIELSEALAHTNVKLAFIAPQGFVVQSIGRFRAKRFCNENQIGVR